MQAVCSQEPYTAWAPKHFLQIPSQMSHPQFDWALRCTPLQCVLIQLMPFPCSRKEWCFAVWVDLEYTLSSCGTRFIGYCSKFFVLKLFALAIAILCFFLVWYGVKGHELETGNKYAFDILLAAFTSYFYV